MKPRLSVVVGVLLFSGAAGCGDDGSGGTGGTGGGTGGAGGGSGGSGPNLTCDATHTCDSGSFCAVYTLPPLCGGEVDPGLVNDCETDADCTDAGTNFICDDKLCDFPHGGGQPSLHCRQGCGTAADCGPGFDCGAAHHCIAASCTTPTECGDDFSCDVGACAPKTCAANDDCGGYCVNGSCSATIGQCQQAVP